MIPVYNEADMIVPCAHRSLSALEKNFSNFEIILINAGGRDRSGDVMHALAAR